MKSVKSKKKRQEFIKRFCRHKLALAGLFILAIEIVLILFLPIVMNLDPVGIETGAFSKPPSVAHILGTDEVGRDVFARLIYGGRVSLGVGIVSTLISIIIGLPLGLLAAYYGGILETIIMRLGDIFMSFPTMILILVLVSIFGPSIVTVTIVIGVLSWISIAKLIYSSVIVVKKKEYVESARAIGTKESVIIWKYILPNSIAPLWMSVSFRISEAMITESALSFLGCGVQPPDSSWGNMIYAAQKLTILTNQLWMWVPAGFSLMLTIVCINFIGEGIRDALDPKMRS